MTGKAGFLPNVALAASKFKQHISNLQPRDSHFIVLHRYKLEGGDDQKRET